MIIGITGPIGAGKGTVAEHLVKKGFKYYSLSDVIRQELKSRKEEPSRDNMIRTGNELRIRYGAGVLAEKTSEWIKDEQKSGRRDLVVDSIRNPS
ncbi:MAG: AAA family ATPase, partial [Candidatus Woesearchaeota archaeon]|nr:AAA family ATPase [Candidatus Woesearchaeota archaeon]